MRPVRFGTLGAARITPAALLRPAKQLDSVEVTAVAARDHQRASRFAAKRGIPRVLDSYEALVADPDIDAVYIPLPNSHHAEWTIAALEAGKHVLCEKPFTANAEEARRVADVSARHPDLVVMEALHWRYHPLAEAVIDIVRSGEIGELHHVETALCIPLLLLGDIRWQLDLAGGSMMDVGCYTVSMLRHLAGAEPTVRAARTWERSPGIDRRTEADFEFPDGSSGRITAAMLSRTVFRMSAVVEGTRGSIRIFNPVAPQFLHRCTVTVDGRTRRLRFPRTITSYGRQLEAVVAAIRDGTPVHTPPADSIATMTVIDDSYRAAGLSPRPSRPGSTG